VPDSVIENPLSLAGRRILITGASSGIGRASALLASRLGARVVLVGRNQHRLEETAARLSGDGHLIETFDIAETSGIGTWFQRLAKEDGPFHGLVHAAGVHTFSPLRVVDLDEVAAIMRINFSSALALTQAFRKKGANLGGGSVVFLASVAGLVGQAGVSAYSASKGALLAAARSLAIELAPERIRVNCIAPGIVESEMSDRIRDEIPAEKWDSIVSSHPLGIGTPTDVANAAMFLLADSGRWITGTTLVIDGGYTCH
jgi:NAD(P)-dependent dehydrogenase (short-subunit alcohol dehydrogenase family)